MRKRFLKWALVTMMVLSLVIIGWLLSGDDQSIGKQVTFSNGSTMTLLHVTHGTEHSHPPETLRDRIAMRLPKALTARLGFKPKVERIPSQQSLGLWFSCPAAKPPHGDPQLVFYDEMGAAVLGWASIMKLGGPAQAPMDLWYYPVWPRRDKTFTLRIFEPGAGYGEATLVGEFTLRNPTPGVYPEWPTPSLPQTARNGDLTATLFDFKANVGQGSLKWKAAIHPVVANTRAGFHVEQNGKPTSEWEIVGAKLTDATGNSINGLWSSGREKENDAEYVSLQPHLWASESAWKMQVAFSQRSNFVASELWTIRGLPLTSVREQDLPRETNLHGLTLAYKGQQRRGSLKGDHHFTFTVAPPDGDYRLTLVSAVDDQGRLAKQVSSFRGPGERTFALKTETNAASLDVTVALHQTRFLEFLAKPTTEAK